MFRVPVALLALAALSCVAIGCTAPVPPLLTLEPDPSHPIRACEIICYPSGHITFEHQHLCSGGSKRQWRDVWLMERVLDHFLVCVEYDIKERQCTLAREVAREAIVLKTCWEFQREMINTRDASERGVQPGEDERGDPRPPPNDE